jgi:hypothetical protein
MGAGSSVRREIRIAAPPAKVRGVHIGFSLWPEWSDGMMISIPEDRRPEDLLPGDRIRSELDGVVTYPIIAVRPESNLN